MNLNNQPTVDQLAQLFAARKDSLDNHILWVCTSGEVHIDRLAPCTGEEDFEARTPNMRARLKMYRRGQGYVGKKAAADAEFVGQVLHTLQAQWPGASEQHGVKVIDRLS